MNIFRGSEGVNRRLNFLPGLISCGMFLKDPVCLFRIVAHRLVFSRGLVGTRNFNQSSHMICSSLLTLPISPL